MAVWGAWFHAGVVVGVDLDLRQFQAHWPVLEVLGANRSGNIQAVQGDGRAPSQWADGQLFDIIVDDAGSLDQGAHTVELSVALFCELFPSVLASGGLYIIEDAWDMHLLVKVMADIVVAHVQVPAVSSDLDDGNRANAWRRKSSDWRDKIIGIEFRRNLILIEKL